MKRFLKTTSLPVGTVRCVATDAALTGVYLENQDPDLTGVLAVDSHPILDFAISELQRYFEGTLTDFSTPVEMNGTNFQRRVWTELGNIPFGSTRSYGELAATLGKPTASRAVGAANGQNPISIIVPCHRVIAKSGALTGYAGGLDAKRLLLSHESRPPR